MTSLRAPYLKAAIIFAVLAALYGGFYLATHKPVAASHFKTSTSTGLHAPRGFHCQMDILSKTEFRIGCVPDCRIPPEPPLPDEDTHILRAMTGNPTTPAAWHQVCDGKRN